MVLAYGGLPAARSGLYLSGCHAQNGGWRAVGFRERGAGLFGEDKISGIEGDQLFAPAEVSWHHFRTRVRERSGIYVCFWGQAKGIGKRSFCGAVQICQSGTGV